MESALLLSESWRGKEKGVAGLGRNGEERMCRPYQVFEANVGGSGLPKSFAYVDISKHPQETVTLPAAVCQSFLSEYTGLNPGSGTHRLLVCLGQASDLSQVSASLSGKQNERPQLFQLCWTLVRIK